MTARPLSTVQHAAIDYTWSLLMPLLPRALGWNREARHICDTVAAVGAVQSMMTDYEAGLLPVLPMQAHLAMDGLIGAGLIGVAALDEDQPVAVRLTLLGAGLFALAATTMTNPIPSGHGHKKARRTATRVGLLAGETAGAIAGR
jgi:hypothetical protein